MKRIVGFLLLWFVGTNAFWITDYYPQEYDVGAVISVKANSMMSEQHPNEPQDYYSAPFCEAGKRTIQAARRAENLGEILIGDKVLPTPYSVEMKVERAKLQVCSRSYNANQIKRFRELVSRGYRVRWLLDSLPNLQPLKLKDKAGTHHVTIYEQGFDLGYLASNDSSSSHSVYVYSHVEVEVEYHGRHIVGFRTLPTQPVLLHTTHDEQDTVDWSYSVKWVSSEKQWGSRWDVYGLHNTESKSVYLMSTLTSMVFILLLTLYLRRKLGHRILQNLGMTRSSMCVQQVSENLYSVSLDPVVSAAEELKAEQEEAEGYDEIDLEKDTVAPWMLLRNMIYLPPRAPELLCAVIGAGIQILVIVLTIALLAMLGIVYAAHRGLLVNCIVVTFFVTAGVNSFVSSWLYKSLVLSRRDDILNFVLSFTLLPVLLLLIIFPVNIMLHHKNAASSIPWLTLGMMIFAWLAISFFTACVGYYLGKNKSVTHLRTTKYEQSVPVSIATRGVLPHLARIGLGFASFLVLWIPLKFIYMSIWGTLFYQLYTLQWVSMLLWLFFSMELCILYVFWQLNAENHKWWWCSYLAGISVSLPSLLYSLLYYAVSSDITSFGSLVIYFGYALLFTLLISLLCGSVCFLGTLFFIRRSYAMFKID